MRRLLLIGPALGVVALAGAPTAALAASVGVNPREGHLIYQAAPGERNDVRVTAGARGVCRENHPASCTGTAQLELADEAVTPELAFSGPNRYRFVLTTEAARPLPPGAERSDALMVRVRSQNSAGAPTNDAFPASMLLSVPLLF
jgi:hypothetical protein